MIYEDQLRRSSQLQVRLSLTEVELLVELTAKPDQQTRSWNSTIRLGRRLVQRDHPACPVPLDMNILKAMSSALLWGLDFYLWLNYRNFALRAPLRLSWRALYRQFGADPAKASDKRIV